MSARSSYDVGEGSAEEIAILSPAETYAGSRRETAYSFVAADEPTTVMSAPLLARLRREEQEQEQARRDAVHTRPTARALRAVR